MKKQNIVLVGPPGAGKSTVSQALADRLKWLQVDTDIRIAKKEKRQITDIFNESGEPYFRQVEENVVDEVMSGADQIVATGGGAVLSAANRERMLEGGYVVALRASLETILERVKHDSSRPLLLGDTAERLRHIMEQRKHAYDFADLSVDTDQLSVNEIADLIINEWKKT